MFIDRKEILMGVVISLILVLVCTLLVYFYRYVKKAYQHFDEWGIPHIKPKTFLGNMADVVLLRQSFAVAHLEMYKKLAPHKFAGFYTLLKPYIMIRDPELIKHVTTKDFVYFQNRGFEFHKELEPLSNHLFSMKGEEWKNLRIKLTSTFTTGKMKMMFPLMTKCAEQLGSVLDKESLSNPEGFEVKDICSRFTTDIIGSCAFGVETHSLDNPDSEFRRMGKRIFEFKYKSIIRSLCPNISPKLVKLFKMEFLAKDVSDYFISIIENMVKYREKNGVTRYDFLDLLIALKNNTQVEKFKHQNDEDDLKKFLEQIGDKHMKCNVDMTVELMAAQCFIFFAAGFETASTTLSFAFLELAQSKDVQMKVREEIINVLKDHNGLFTYEALREMTYLDMVISETLRLYPPAPFLTRECFQNYKIPDSEVVIKEGALLIIPVFGLHRDKQYYEKPDQFYPEHFSKEAIANRHHYVYVPFGEGPRVCIAERFARMQVKVGLAYMLKNHRFELSPQMKIPVEFAGNFGLLQVKGGVWLKCERI